MTKISEAISLTTEKLRLTAKPTHLLLLQVSGFK